MCTSLNLVDSCAFKYSKSYRRSLLWLRRSCNRHARVAASSKRYRDRRDLGQDVWSSQECNTIEDYHDYEHHYALRRCVQVARPQRNLTTASQEACISCDSCTLSSHHKYVTKRIQRSALWSCLYFGGRSQGPPTCHSHFTNLIATLFPVRVWQSIRPSQSAQNTQSCVRSVQDHACPFV